MSAESCFHRGNEHYVLEDWSAALEQYDLAIDLNNSLWKVFIARSGVFLELRDFKSALGDADQVIKYQADNALAHFRKGTALFLLGRFDDACKSFDKAVEHGHTTASRWVRKCAAAQGKPVSNAPIANQPVKTNNTSTSAPVSKATPNKTKTTTTTTAASLSPSSSSSSSSSAAPRKKLADKVRFSWIQNTTDVTITVFAKNLSDEQIRVRFAPKQAHVELSLSDGSTFSKTFSLPHEIDASQSSHSHNAYKVFATLRKAQLGHDWKTLQQEDANGAAVSNQSTTTSVYSAVPGKKPVNWDELDAQAKKDEEEEKPEGEAALNKLFQSIYKGADDETKRAMMKSYQTSGGTVLSTNWGEVKKADYEKTAEPPQGMQMNKWSS